MKQQVLFCLLLTIGAGTCNGYGVKGSFSKSYSSSSASASSSAFSSSFSSGDDANLNEITKSLNAGAQASAAAFAQADADGAKAGSGSFATAGSAASAGGFAGGTSGSGSSSKSDLQIGSGVQLGHGSHSVNSGSYSASGAIAGTGTTCTTCSGYAGNSGNSGSSSSKQNNVNSAGSASDSGSTSNVLVNNFEIPNDYSNPKSAPAFDKLNKGFESDNHNAAYSGSIEGSKSCCQGPFPGPKGSISDFKPAPPGGGAPPAWTPEEQQPTNTGTIGISTQLIHSFPGSHGGIHDSKPAFDKPYNGGSIPVSVVVETPHQPQTHVPGSDAISVIGTLPGPTGSIYTSIPSGHQPEPQYVPIPQIPSQPGPSLDLIHSFPGKPGNIHDSKVVPCTGGWCQSNQQGYNVNQNSNTGTGSISGNYKPESYHPKFPDCSTGQCDEYGGKLACHGNDCFGPGKKPSNAHFSAGASANSNANHESGSININLSEPSTDTYQQSPCKSGNCNGKPTDAGGQSPQKPAVDLTPINVPSGSQQNGYPAPGSINFGVDHPIPSSPGSLCSGLECLLPGTKETPSSSSKDCSGAYCINVVPESQIIPSCSSGNCHNQQKNIQKSDSTSTVEQPIEAEPTHIQKETPAAIDKPHDQGPGASQDFLLPGNKPYHRHSIKPSHPKKEHEKPASEGYYTCTGTSCPLPKHPGQITSQPSQNFEPSKLTPFNIPDEYKGAGGHDRLYPGYTQKESPQLKPFKIPNEYKVQEDQEQKEETPVDIPVLIGGEPQIQGNKPVSHYTGNNGFVAGEVIVQKSEDTVVPVVDVFIPGSIKPGYQCSGSQCGGYKPTTNDGFVQGTNSGAQSSSSGAHNQGNVHGNDCSGGWCKIPIAGGFNGAVSGSQADTVSENLQGNIQGSGCTGGKCGTELNAGSNSGSGSYGGGCTSGNCGLNGGLSGSQSGASSENIQGYSQGSGCTGGKCGTGAGSHSGSGSYGGGCTNGNCGLNGGLSGSQAGASNENIQGYSQGSGCTGGKCGTDSNAGSNSGSGSYGGGCTSGKCGLNGGLSGSQAGASSENIQGNFQGSGCTGGKCGTGAGSHSGSGSYLGSGSYGGAKGGCKGGSCGFSGNNGAYSGAFSSSSSFGGSGSGGYNSHGSGSKAFSSSGSGAFLSNAQGGGFGGLPLLKELINQSIKVGDFHSGAGAFSGSGAYSGGGSVAHSSAYSSAGSFSAK
ncbi:uncharacterized protein LOC130444037 [Diorhabda sublineata]|uniref:uncharacterized protein LOC130444037 n=1 Tax=Diorhabda sublineata TaxID=1163346 RepID=UPI0024E163C2|nr:uncharacterized protein LOC130444037 [Diorhabda sublineata]